MDFNSADDKASPYAILEKIWAMYKDSSCQPGKQTNSISSYHMTKSSIYYELLIWLLIWKLYISAYYIIVHSQNTYLLYVCLSNDS